MASSSTQTSASSVSVSWTSLDTTLTDMESLRYQRKCASSSRFPSTTISTSAMPVHRTCEFLPSLSTSLCWPHATPPFAPQGQDTVSHMGRWSSCRFQCYQTSSGQCLPPSLSLTRCPYLPDDCVMPLIMQWVPSYSNTSMTYGIPSPFSPARWPLLKPDTAHSTEDYWLCTSPSNISDISSRDEHFMF